MAFEDLDNDKNKIVAVETEEKVGLGVKVVLTVAILGSIAAGIFIALMMS
ncbi:MAG: hypothetical protein ACNFW9_03160 [Candidatus Kerfeldbacteria bacterium]|jgi:hypothetical protein